MVARIQLPPEIKEALLNRNYLPEKLTIKGVEYILKAPVTAGFKGAVWKVLDEHDRLRAVKFAIYEDYVDRSYLGELAYAAKLENYPEFARFINADIIELDLHEHGKRKFVCFIEDWINGFTLEEYLEKHADEISGSFLLHYVEGMCSALSALKAVNLRHDDLHAGNVMLERPALGMLSDTLRVKIIDTGSLKPLDQPTKKGKDDHRNFIEHLVAIHNAIQKKKLLPVKDRRFLKECLSLYDSMLDDDSITTLKSPEQIKSHFSHAFTRANFSRASKSLTLQSPFEFISAEHIADDRLLVEIFAQSCPWLDKVEGPDPCLVTGPRGCGKSTIFRWLSLKAHLHKSSSEIESFRIAGFYISCSSDLQNRLSWIKTEALAEKKFRREVVHYFNLILAREVIQTLCNIRERPDHETFWGLGHAQEEKIHGFLKDALMSSHLVMQGVSRLQQAVELLELEMFRCHVQMLKGLNLEWTTPETFLGDFTTLLSKEITFFRERPIAFLLDDFSTHRLPEPVQIVLNRIIWERRATHIFKLSSEKYGARLSDSHDATADLSREMVEIDCGREYLALDDHDQREKARKFATELLANRLLAAGYAGSPEQLLGPSEWEEGSLARALRARRDKPGRTNNQYHGSECIADLCSGDVSTLLLVYRRIFEKGNVNKDSTSNVPKHIQHQAIDSVSSDLLEAIKNHHPFGMRMYMIVREFGTLVKRILIDGDLIKQGTSTVPPQCPRIEVDQDYNSPEDELNTDQANLKRELVRRAIFIEMEPGRSRHKSVTTLRWQLRRVYLPAFGASLSKNDAIKWKPAHFKFFLLEPKQSCDREWRKKTASDGEDDAQEELF
jgi:predicted heme/steroid binding protein